MLLPIGDEPRLAASAPATWGLIAVNVAVYALICLPLTDRPASLDDPLLPAYLRSIAVSAHLSPRQLIGSVSAYDLLVFRYGFRPAAPSALGLLTSLFLHAGWLHLGGNMLFLWIFGANVEARLGRLAYLLVYLLCGIAGTLFFALFQGTSNVPLVGASGAISGVLGCYFVWFGEHRVRLLAVLVFFVDVIRVPVRWVLGFYVLVENLLPYLSGDAGSVAYGAHIGGFAAGAAFAAAAARRRAARAAAAGVRFVPRGGGAAGPPSPSPAASPPAAAANPAAAWLAAADALTEQRQYTRALAPLQALLASAPAAPEAALAHLRAGLIYWRGLGARPQARAHLLACLAAAPPAQVAEAAAAALAALDRADAAELPPP